MTAAQSTNIAKALHRHYARNQRWGFIWALWTAVLWGVWYIPGTAVWYEPPFNAIQHGDQTMKLGASAVVTFVHAVAVLAFLFLWNAVLQKNRDFLPTILRFRRLSKWYALASVFGGPMAIFGSYLAMGFVGPVFAVVTSLFYPVVGALVAWLWFRERITARVALGMAFIIFAGLVIYGPGLFGEADWSRNDAWIGYLGGALAAIGWGVEGAIAARAMDVSDPDVGLQCRFTFEVLCWALLILPAFAWFTEVPVWALLVDSLTQGDIVMWTVLAAVVHAFCYTAFYKSFGLIGVGRGEAISNLHAIFGLGFIAAFTLVLPEWYSVVGLVAAVAGSLIMVSESAESIVNLRDIDKLAGTGEVAYSETE